MTRSDGPRRGADALPEPSPEDGRHAGAGRARLLSDHAYEAVLAMILNNSIPVGGRLPTEHALSADLNVSRPVIRQALRQLRDDGIVVSRQGSGSFVSRRPDASFLAFAPVGSIQDIQRTFEFRAAMEGEAAAFAAQRRDARDIDRMERAYADLDGCVKAGELGVDADEALHEAICDAAGNVYFSETRRMMRSNILTGMNVTRNLSLQRPQGRMTLVQEEHRRILDAIKSQSVEAARSAMRGHIENARSRMFGDARPSDV